MSAHTCCQAMLRESKAKTSRIGRATSSAKWILPSAGLVLMPKCPMCLAAYLAVAGVGISFETADWIRSILLWTFTASLTLLTALTLRRLIARRRAEAMN